MTLQEFAQRVVSSDAYRESVVARAAAGTLPADVEIFILELADGRMPVAAELGGAASARAPLSLVRPSAAQSSTLAVIRRPDEEEEDA
jgi:hypothetical protein